MMTFLMGWRVLDGVGKNRTTKENTVLRHGGLLLTVLETCMADRVVKKENAMAE